MALLRPYRSGTLMVLDRGYANFVELRNVEVQLPRILLPRTRVNRAREGRAEAQVFADWHDRGASGDDLLRWMAEGEKGVR